MSLCSHQLCTHLPDPAPSTHQVFGFIIGRQGATKKRIESESGGATLILPSPTQKPTAGGSVVVVRAPTQAILTAAVSATRKLIVDAVAGKLLEPTHFISIPLIHPSVVQQVRRVA